MMEIARVFAAHTKPKWPVLFAAWSGEEEGFYGAYAYVNRPYFPLKETIAYLNLDMVGYGQQLTAEVSKAHSMLRGVVTESSQELEISLGVLDYSGGSDVVPFEEKRVQNVMLIYWPDEVYHTPQDTADHVSKTNLVETARLTALMAARLSEVTILTTTETPASRPAWRVPLQSLVIVVCVGVAGAAVLVYQIRKKHKAITATQTMMPEQR